jgi:hypothetical protein
VTLHYFNLDPRHNTNRRKINISDDLFQNRGLKLYIAF